MPGTEGDSKPATDRFVRAKVVDWSQNQYVRGCYAHPSLGALMTFDMCLAEDLRIPSE
jgi:hypothetical protein